MAVDFSDLFWSGSSLACAGIVLLFLARWPLYRQKRFLDFGPSALPAFNRKLYWLAYIMVIGAVLLLGIVWLRIK